MDILDFHTHRLDATDALISVSPREFNPQPGKWYSVGYHPWRQVDALVEEDFDLLEQCARHDQVLAIGETGLDRLRGAELDIQAAMYVRHLKLAATLGKPVVVHSVRTAQDILNERHKAGLDDVQLIIHGMRGNAHVGHVLLQAGCYLSFGPHFNPDAILITPMNHLLIETDDSKATIDEVASLVATVLNIEPQDIKTTAASNARRLLLG